MHDPAPAHAARLELADDGAGAVARLDSPLQEPAGPEPPGLALSFCDRRPRKKSLQAQRANPFERVEAAVVLDARELEVGP